jgi:DNA-nicking Smr family endonuclease
MVRFPKPPYELPPEDVVEWQDAISDVTPLRRIKTSPQKMLEVSPSPTPAPSPIIMNRAFIVETRLRSISASQASLPAIDEPTLRRIRLEKMRVDRTLDLHGMTEEAAYTALSHFLQKAHFDACQLVLVITGKGSVTTGGILRSALPRWCRDVSISPFVIALHRAHSRHGGDGAYYIRVRKDKNKS